MRNGKELTHREVNAAVDSQLRVEGVALHEPLERPDVLGLPQEREHAARVGEAPVGVIGKTSLHAARVVLVRVARVIAAPVDSRQAARAQVDGIVDKRPRGDAAAAAAGGEVHGRVALVGVDDDVVVLGVVHGGAVAAHGGRAAVKDGRVGEALLGGSGPVPVGEGALVAALIAQGLLVLPDEPAVPAQEAGGLVDGEGLVDVLVAEQVSRRARARFFIFLSFFCGGT